MAYDYYRGDHVGEDQLKTQLVDYYYFKETGPKSFESRDSETTIILDDRIMYVHNRCTGIDVRIHVGYLTEFRLLKLLKVAGMK